MKRIAVLRANALGDLIFALPALAALRHSFPGAELVLLGREMHARLLAGRKAVVDRVEVIPRYPGVGERSDIGCDAGAIESFFARMREERFDVAFQMHGGGRFSNAFVRRLGAGLTVGSRTADADALDISVPYTTYFSEALRHLELVSLVGARPASIAPVFPVIEADLHSLAAEVPCGVAAPVAVLQPGASDPRRWWPWDKFRRVAEALLDRGFTVCINGTRDETALAGRIAAGLEDRGRILDLSGRLSLNGLVGLLSRASLMVSNDTGPLHLANALGVPSVGIFWVPNIVTGSPVWSRHVRALIAWSTTCPDCGRGFSERAVRCGHTSSLVAEIGVEEVMNAIDEVVPVSERRAAHRAVVNEQEVTK